MDGTIFSMTGKSLVLTFKFVLIIDCYFRFNVSPKVTQAVIHHSGASVSDSEIEPTASDSPDSFPCTQPKTPARSRSSHIVSEPNHQVAKQFRSVANASFSAVGDFLQQKATIDKERLKLIRKCEARREEDEACRQVEQERTQKADMAKLVLLMDAATEEVKAVANNFLLSLF